MTNYSLIKLNNGLRINLIQKNIDSLNIGLFVNVGSVNENKNNNGISHLLEHLIFWETKNDDFYPLNLDIDASTRKDFTLFEVTTHKRYFNKVLNLLFGLVLNPNFEKSRLKDIKGVVQEEIADFFDSPYNILDYEIDKKLFKNSPLSFNIAGSKKSISSININQIKEWHSNYYVSQNMILTIVGNIDVKKVKKEVQKHLKFKNKQNVKLTKVQNFKLPTTKKFEIKSNKFQQGYISLIYPISALGGRNYFKELLLGEIINNKLRMNLDNNNLFYDLTVLNEVDLYKGSITIVTSCDPGNINRVVKLLEDEIANIKIEADFFEKTKDYFKHKILLKEDDVEALSSLTLYLLGGSSDPVTIKDEFKQISSVNLSEVRNLKKKVFDRKNKFVFVLV